MNVQRDSLGDVFDAIRVPRSRLGHVPDLEEPPWYMGLISGVAAWMSALAFLMFLGLAGILESKVAALGLGSVFAVGACLARRSTEALPGQFFRQLTLPVVLAGELLVLYPMMWWSGDLALFAAGLFIAGMVVAYADPFHRFVATIASGTLLGFGVYSHLEFVPLHLFATVLFAVSTVLYVREADIEVHIPNLRAPVALGSLVGCFLLIGLAMTGPPDQQALTWVSTFGITGVVVTTALSAMRQELGISDLRVVGGTVLVLAVVCALTVNHPGIIAALGTLMLAFHRRKPFLLVAGVAGLAGFLFLFYYDLALTFWVKSGLVIGTGAVLLLARTSLIRNNVELSGG